MKMHMLVALAGAILLFGVAALSAGSLGRAALNSFPGLAAAEAAGAFGAKMFVKSEAEQPSELKSAASNSGNAAASNGGDAKVEIGLAEESQAKVQARGAVQSIGNEGALGGGEKQARMEKEEDDEFRDESQEYEDDGWGVQVPPQPPIPPGNSTANSASSISPSVLASHHVQADCWVAYQGKVYDITAWLPMHPGSASAIAPYCGTSSQFEAAFTGQHGTSQVQRLLAEGVLKGSFAA